MKKLLNLLFIGLAFATLVFLTSCGKKDDGPKPKTGAETNAALLNGTWTVDDAQGKGVKFGTDAAAGDWSGFRLTISGATKEGGNYTAAGTSDAYEEGVWPASGSWTFDNDQGDQITRSDKTKITAVIAESTVVLQFSIPDPAARVAGIRGEQWTFNLKK
ncbi:MAG: hypothetical protein OXH57_04385 [Ekhidna sp.]|nr:hypothetical protein [Ekhidna sp.]